MDAVILWAKNILGDPLLEARSIRTRKGSRTLRLTHGPRALAYIKLAPDLRGERDRIIWLSEYLPVPDILGFKRGAEDWLLMRALPGMDLSNREYKKRPEAIIRHLTKALIRLHALDPTDCPFGSIGRHVIHGDACLPNFVFNRNRLSGYVDLGDLGVGPVEHDLAACIWSLDYNLGPGFGGKFLRAYGWPRFDDETVEIFRRSYIDADLARSILPRDASQ